MQQVTFETCDPLKLRFEEWAWRVYSSLPEYLMAKAAGQTKVITKEFFLTYLTAFNQRANYMYLYYSLGYCMQKFEVKRIKEK